MNVKSVEKENGKAKVVVEIDKPEFEQALNKAYAKCRKDIMLPGFRKGKAPRKLIERMYGPSVFYEDALEALFPDAYMTAVKDHDLRPVGRPELDVQQMEAGKELLFSCEVFVYPEVTLGQYKGVEVERTVRTVTDAEVDERVEQERKRVARSVEITDRALENGDKAQLDYSGSVDGEKFDGGTASNQTLVIGSGSFIPGFEEQMVGMSIGEERDLKVTFPKEYHAENLKGKDAVFHVKLLGITREELPELDDEFAAEVSDFDTLAQYREDIKTKLQQSYDAQTEEGAKQALIQKVVENATIDVPDPMVEDKLDEMIEQMSWRMQQQGFTMERYLQLLGQTEKQMRDMYRSEALNNVRTELVLDEIIKAEDIQASDEDVDKLLSSYAGSVGQTVEQLRESFGEEQLAYFTHRAKVEKALDLLWDSAVVTDKAPQSEPQPDTQA